jgi:hypothetical protein
MNLADRVAAARAERAPKTQAAPLEKRVRVAQAAPEAVAEAAPSSEKVFDIANNTVAGIMQRSDLSDKGKLDAVVAFLTAKDDNYGQVEKNFAEFEAYFTYEQSMRTQVSEQNIQRLMDELEDGTKSTIEHILNDFNVVNAGAGNIRQLLGVMERARLDGTTVEVLTEAFRLNEQLLKEIAALNMELDKERKEQAAAAQTQGRLEGISKDSQTGVLNKLFRAFSSSESMSDSLYYSSYSLKLIETKIQQFQRTISDKQGQRDKRLEDGELTILRTVDATEGGFTDQILRTARDSLALIKGTRASIEKLLASNATSRAASGGITATLNESIGRETVLRGALRVASKETHRQGEILDEAVDHLKRDKADAADDAARVTLVTVKLDKASQTGKGALDYERVLEAKVVSFEMVASANVQAEARAQQFATLVEAHHELLSNLQQQALPVTASALEMGLQQGVALRDGLLAACVRDATKKAQAIFGSNLEGANDARTTLENENLGQMREAIAALGKAQALIRLRTDKAIEHGLASMDLVGKVTASADGVRAAMADFQRVDAALAAAPPPAAPPAPHAPEAQV